MTTTMEPTDLDVPEVFAEPVTAPEPAAKPDDLTPALRLMVDELDDVYKGADCPSIDKTAATMKNATGNKSWDSRGQVDKARAAYRARHRIEPAKKPARTAPTKPARTKPPTPRRTAVVRAEPQPVVQVEPPVVQPDPVPQTAETVRTAPAKRGTAWPVIIIALPAMVAIWSGWVGLGGLTGFGVVHPLPGIADAFSINTAITLPIGVEAYAAYAMRKWLSGQVPDRAKRFAKWSAIGSLIVGALGQVAYHVLVAFGVQSAPWQITTLVACLPVAVVGMAAALHHLCTQED